MAETLVTFTTPIRGRDGRLFWPKARGAVADDGLCEGWLEFTSDDGQVAQTTRETEQPNRDDLLYWAEGLSVAYLEGALERALGAATPREPGSLDGESHTGAPRGQ